MSDKVIVIGATGLLGSSTVRLLSQTQSVVDLRRRGSAGPSFAAEIRIVDLFEPRSIADAISDAKTILFFPAFSTPSSFTFDVRHELTASATALANLIEAAAAISRRPHIVFPSTGGAIYGSSEIACTEQAARSAWSVATLLEADLRRNFKVLRSRREDKFHDSSIFEPVWLKPGNAWFRRE